MKKKVKKQKKERKYTIMDYDPFDAPMACMDKMSQLRCSFDGALQKLGGIVITDEDDCKNAELYRYWVRIDDLRNVDKSVLTLHFANDGDSFTLNLDNAKKLLKRLTTVVDTAEAIEEKFFKEMEEIKKEQQKPADVIKNNIFDVEVAEK